MPDSITEQPEDAKELWEKHLKEGYRNLPSRNTYNKVVQNSVVENKVNNKKETISVVYHTFESQTKTHTLSVDVEDEYVAEPSDLSDVDPFETDFLLRSHQVIDCSTCEGSGIHCSNCFDKGTKSCPENNCDNGMIKVDCGCDFGKQTTTCSACGGSGYSIKEQCRQCDGTGTYFENGSEEKCYKCDSNGIFTEVCLECNNGEVREECTNCNGAGTLTKGQCNTCGQYPETEGGRIPCPECEHQTKDQECSNCEGEGEVIEVELLKVVNKSLDTTNKEENFKDKHLRKLPDLEYSAQQDTTFDTLQELRMCRSEEIDADLPEEISESSDDLEHIDKIEYKFETTQAIQRYAYHHTGKIYTLKKYLHYKFKDKETYYFKKIEGIPRVATLEVTQDGKLVDKMQTKNFIYGSWFKCAVVNLSSKYTTPNLSLSQKLVGFVPAVMVSFYKNGLIESGFGFWISSIMAAIPGYITAIGLITIFGVDSIFGLEGQQFLYSIIFAYAFIIYIILYVFGEEDPTPNIDSELLRN